MGIFVLLLIFILLLHSGALKGLGSLLGILILTVLVLGLGAFLILPAKAKVISCSLPEITVTSGRTVKPSPVQSLEREIATLRQRLIHTDHLEEKALILNHLERLEALRRQRDDEHVGPN